MRAMNSAEPARLARLERQVDYLLQHFGIDADLAAGEMAGSSPFGSPGDIFGAPAVIVPPVRGPAMSTPAASPYPPELTAAIARGDKIRAIKICREVTGVGLREAKTAVETLERGGQP
jgi:hypothetical protein